MIIASFALMGAALGGFYFYKDSYTKGDLIFGGYFGGIIGAIAGLLLSIFITIGGLAYGAEQVPIGEPKNYSLYPIENTSYYAIKTKYDYVFTGLGPNGFKEFEVNKSDIHYYPSDELKLEVETYDFKNPLLAKLCIGSTSIIYNLYIPIDMVLSTDSLQIN